MKKVLLIISVIAFIVINISNDYSLAASQTKIQVVTSLPLIKNIGAKIGGDKILIESMIHGTACSHEYEPSAKDMKLLAKCDVFIKIGMNADSWAEKLTQGVISKKTLLIDSSQEIKIIKIRGIENPHYWGNPENVKIIAKNILNGFCSIKPEWKNYFQKNYDKYLKKVDQTIADLKLKSAKIAKKPFISYSNAFPYFYNYFGFQNLMTIETSCEQEVSPKDIAAAAKLMKQQQIKVIIGDAAEPNEPDGLVKETKAKKVLLWATTDESEDYLETLRRNVETMVSVLQ